MPVALRTVTPSICTSIFRVWYCESFLYSDVTGVEHTFLAGDLAISCDAPFTPEYARLRAIAWVLIFLWPIGMLVLYAALLLACRSTLVNEDPATTLVRATRFLHIDYKPQYFFWEGGTTTPQTAAIRTPRGPSHFD